MKTTSRRSFGKHLTGAIVTLPLTALAGKTALGEQPDQQKPVLSNNRNEHDTPPPVIIMAGSCIFEARTEKDHVWTTFGSGNLGNKPARVHKVPAYDNNGDPANGPIHIAHIKIVDGSGEMLYRLDNDDKDDITITTFLKKDKSELASLKADGTDFSITYLDNKKLEKEDPSMDPEEETKNKRQRAKYKDENAKDGKIYRIEVSGDKAGILYGLKVNGHKAATELRVMVWWEV